MSTIFNTAGGVVSLPATPTNTLNLAVKASLGQGSIMRNLGNFYSSWDATLGVVQQQFSIAASASLALPSGASGLMVYSNGGALTVNLSKTTGTVQAPAVANYTVYMQQMYMTDDSLSGVTLVNTSTTDAVTGFLAYIPYTFSG